MSGAASTASYTARRIAEDEAAALAAGGADERWHADGGTVTRGHPVDRVVDYTTASAHIARHDPARVLRECAARRRTLERHQAIDIGSRGQPCLRCAHCIQAGIVAWPCEDVTDLAATWADHLDYEKGWGG